MRISETFIVQSRPLNPLSVSDEISTNTISSLESSGITFNSSTLNPSIDNNFDIGSPVKRFRNINSVSGTTSIWSVCDVVNTPSLNLGIDSNNESRLITANNSVIQYDTLVGGDY
jgi:hypothetical protein